MIIEICEQVALRLGWRRNPHIPIWQNKAYILPSGGRAGLMDWYTDDGVAVQDLIPLIQRHVEAFTISWSPSYGYDFNFRLADRAKSNFLFTKITFEDRKSLAKLLCHAVIAIVPLEEV